MDPRVLGSVGRRPMHNNMNNSSSGNNPQISPRSSRENYSDYYRFPPPSVKAHSRNDSSGRWDDYIPLHQDPEGSVVEDLDEVKVGDPELVRKRQQLWFLKKKITHNKASIAVKNTFADPTEREADAVRGDTLRDRVMSLLRHRHQPGFFLQFQSPKERKITSILVKDQHPLKVRVKAALRRRRSELLCPPASVTEVPHVPLAPPPLSVPPPAKETDNVNKGFERFLSVLNKGVDINLFSRIVNDDTEEGDLPTGGEFPNIHHQNPEEEQQVQLDPPVMEERQQPAMEAPPPSHSRKTQSPRRERSLSRPPKDGSGGGRLSSRNRSRSPVAAAEKEEAGVEPEVKQQHLQLQNLLKTLGLNLDVEDLRKLGHRTQERLYGKNEASQSADGRGKPESPKRPFHRERRRSSPPSSASSSSSRSPSPSRQRPSPSGASPLHPEAPRSRSGDGDQERSDHQQVLDYQHPEHPYPPQHNYPPPHAAAHTYQSYSHYSYCTTSTVSYQTHHPSLPPETHHPSLPPGTHHPSLPPGAHNSSLPPGTHHPSLPPRAHHPSLPPGTHHPSLPPGTHHPSLPPVAHHPSLPPVAHHPSLPPGTHPSYQQHQFSSRQLASNHTHPHCPFSGDSSLNLNPDLAESEGQYNVAGQRRCLTACVALQPAPPGEPYVQRYSKHSTRRYKRRKRERERRQRLEEGIEPTLPVYSPDSTPPAYRTRSKAEKKRSPIERKFTEGRRLLACEDLEDLPVTLEAEPQQNAAQEKPPPSEEEIKANLRKKLQAFNQKVKRSGLVNPSMAMQPADSLIE